MTDKRKGKKPRGSSSRARDEEHTADQMSREELRGMDLLGRSSVRDGALEGVSEPSAESGIDQPPSPVDLSRRSARRTNPPLSDDALGAGGISSSGGVAGGARGGAGKSSSGAGTPEGYEKAGPGEQKSTSRFDLEGSAVEEPEE